MPNSVGIFFKASNLRARHWPLLVWFVLCVGGCPASERQPGASKAEWRTKLGAELITLYDEYSSYIGSGKQGVFKSNNSLVRVVDDRVIIDAVASVDANALKTDLETLGMRQAVSFGRIVSGQLPIRAIPSMAELSSLNFARAATAVLQEPQSVNP